MLCLVIRSILEVLPDVGREYLVPRQRRGPTPDKPLVTLSVPDMDKINGFMNISIADIEACSELWARYTIEVGQSTDLTYG